MAGRLHLGRESHDRAVVAAVGVVASDPPLRDPAPGEPPAIRHAHERPGVGTVHGKRLRDDCGSRFHCVQGHPGQALMDTVQNPHLVAGIGGPRHDLLGILELPPAHRRRGRRRRGDAES